MIILFNALLVLIGIPLFGISMLLIGAIFSPALRYHLGGGTALLQVSLWWVGFLIPFCAVYKLRSRWLVGKGILGSWRALQSYLREQHPLPEVSEADYARFRARVNTAVKGEAEMKAVYARIQKERPDDRQAFVFALIRYFQSGDFLEFREGEFAPGQAALLVRAITQACGFTKPVGPEDVPWLNSLLRDRKFAARLIEMGRNGQLVADAATVVEDPELTTADLELADMRYILECQFPEETPQRGKNSCGEFEGIDGSS